jgi:hypothetical protein
MGIDSEELDWPWWQLGRIRVERDPTLCGLLTDQGGDRRGGGEWEPNKISFIRNRPMSHVQNPSKNP